MSPAHSFIQLVSPSALGAFSFRPARIYCRERFPENQVCVFQSTQYTGEHFRFRTTLCSASAFRIERERHLKSPSLRLGNTKDSIEPFSALFKYPEISDKLVFWLLFLSAIDAVIFYLQNTRIFDFPRNSLGK